MDIEKIFTGVWWIPKEEDTVMGNLKLYYSTKIELELLSDTHQNIFYRNFDNIPILYGFTSNGKKITLYNAKPFRNGQKSQLHFQYCNVQVAFIGTHYKNKNSKVFINNISANFEGLDSWMKQGYSQSYWTDTKSTHKPIHSIEINRNLSLTIWNRVTDINQKKSMDQFGLNRSISIFLVSKTELDLVKFSTYNEIISIFLTLLLGESTLLSNLHIMASPQNMESHVLFKHPRDIDTNRSFHKEHILVAYPEIDELFPDLLKNWINNYEAKYKTLYDAYGAIARSQNMNLENKILLYTSLLEAFHRRLYPNNRLVEDKKVFRDRKRAIYEKITPEEQEWLKMKLQFSNFKSLSDRLKEMAEDKIPKALKDLYFLDTDLKEIANTRNLFAHYDPQKDDNDFEQIKLYCIAEKARLFLEIVLLSSIGMTKDSIEKSLKKRIRLVLIKKNQ